MSYGEITVGSSVLIHAPDSGYHGQLGVVTDDYRESDQSEPGHQQAVCVELVGGGDVVVGIERIRWASPADRMRWADERGR